MDDDAVRALFARRRALRMDDRPSLHAVLSRRATPAPRPRSALRVALAAAAMVVLAVAIADRGLPSPTDRDATLTLVNEVMTWHADTDVLLEATAMPVTTTLTASDR